MDPPDPNYIGGPYSIIEYSIGNMDPGSIFHRVHILYDTGMTDFNEFCLWKKNIIQEYLHIRGLPTTGNKYELTALAFGAPNIS